MTRALLAIASAALLVVALVVWERGGISENDVAAARVCVNADGLVPISGAACRSPDGAWSVAYTGGSLRLRHRGSASAWAYKSYDSCCTNVMWARPHTLLFVDDYRVFRLDPVTRKHTIIAGWSNIVVSPNGRWIAGWDLSSAIDSETVGALSGDGKTCLVVPQTSHESDEAAGFTPDSKSVIVKRWRFEPNNGPTGSSHLVAYAISSLPPSTRC
jgi:hypothetical protein